MRLTIILGYAWLIIALLYVFDDPANIVLAVLGATVVLHGAIADKHDA